MMLVMNMLIFWKQFSLERQLIAYGTTWIDYISFDPAHGVVVVQLVALIEGDRRRTALVFEDVHEYRANWDDEADEVHSRINGEDLFGLDELVSPVGTRYVINTDCREVSFISTIRPQIWPLVNAG